MLGRGDGVAPYHDRFKWTRGETNIRNITAELSEFKTLHA